MVKLTTWIRKTLGLNNAVDPVRLPYDPEAGAAYLSKAVNVVIDATGRISRRKGYRKVLSGSDVHSLWADGPDCFFVDGGSLYRLLPDFSTKVGLRSGLTPGASMSYVKSGDGKVYYANGFEYGYILGNLSHVWSEGHYYGPPTTRAFTGPRAGHLLEIHQGRMLIADGEVLYHSEPFNFHLFDKAGGWTLWADRVRLLKSVGAGLWVGDSSGTYHVSGPMEEAQVRKISSSVAVPGAVSSALVASSYFSQDPEIAQQGLMAVWAADDGVYAGGPEGLLINLTDRRIVFPAAFGRGAVACTTRRLYADLVTA